MVYKDYKDLRDHQAIREYKDLLVFKVLMAALDELDPSVSKDCKVPKVAREQ